MSLKSSVKRIFIFLALTGILGVALHWWLRSHQRSTQVELNRIIPRDASYAIFNLTELNKLRESGKLFSLPDSDTLPHLSDFLLSPLEMGIDVSVNPILFSTDSFRSFHLVLPLLNSDRFFEWLLNAPGKEWPVKKAETPDINCYHMTDKSMHFSSNDAIALISWYADQGSIVDLFASESPSITNKTAENGDLVTIFTNHPYPFYKGKLHLRCNDESFSVFSSNPAKENSNSYISLNADGKYVKKYPKVFETLFRINDKNRSLFSGRWYIGLNGISRYAVEFITYDFDDNFNRVERRSTTYHTKPSLELSFIPADSLSFISMKEHLTKNKLITKDSLKIGPYSYKLSHREKYLSLADAEIGDMTEQFFIRSHLDFDQIKSVMDSMALSKGILDSIGFADLKTFDIQLTEDNIYFELTNSAKSEYHILAELKALINLISNRTSSPEVQ